MVVFLSKFKDELVYKYYLTELEIIELDLWFDAKIIYEFCLKSWRIEDFSN